MDEARAERLRDRVRQIMADKRSREARAAIDLDALNDYYGFHGRCTCDSSGSATHTQPPKTSETPGL
jgi:hypothetical protein